MEEMVEYRGHVEKQYGALVGRPQQPWAFELGHRPICNPEAGRPELQADPFFGTSRMRNIVSDDLIAELGVNGVDFDLANRR